MKTDTRRTAARGGRPAKFAEPSHPVTMTLPDRVLARLAEIDGDRAKAVVKAVEAALGGGTAVRGPVGELAVSADESLLTVVSCGPLASLPWLTTIEVAPGRHLISLHDGISVEKLEVALQDLLDGPDGLPERDRRVVRTLLERVRAPRRNQAVRTAQILVFRTAPAARRRG